jgi:hypothetical protein
LFFYSDPLLPGFTLAHEAEGGGREVGAGRTGKQDLWSMLDNVLELRRTEVSRRI